MLDTPPHNMTEDAMSRVVSPLQRVNLLEKQIKRVLICYEELERFQRRIT